MIPKCLLNYLEITLCLVVLDAKCSNLFLKSVNMEKTLYGFVFEIGAVLFWNSNKLMGIKLMF